MDNNVLKSDKTEIIVIYRENGTLKKYSAKVSYIDKKECFLSVNTIDKFDKPKPKTKIEIFAKTEQGAFKSDSIITDISFSLTEIIFVVNAPKDWTPLELRKSLRVNASLPLLIKYEDEFEIKTTTDNISIGGINFSANEDAIPEYYKDMVATIIITLPDNEEMKFEGKFLRHDNSKVPPKTSSYTYKFIQLSTINQMLLSRYIQNILSAK